MSAKPAAIGASPSNGILTTRGDRSLSEDAARDRSGEAARADARVREARALDDQAHEICDCGGTGSFPHRSYVKGWKIGPSHFLNQDLATIWLDR
jgi:hypothetical protein